MTDRELLELAAKAAGIEGEYEHRLTGHGIAFPNVSATLWNPLTDDGDALRLAVKLHIDIQSYQESGNVHAHSKQFLGYGTDGVPSYQDNECMTEHLGDAPMAATRRAIVRAAAEIGRTIS